jgi:hypothetical protein
MPSSRSVRKRSADAERLLAVVPSSRVSAEIFVQRLRWNGVMARVLGHGTARVVGHDGRRRRVAGVVVAIDGRSAGKAEKIARLCGITAVLLDRTTQNH